MDKWNDKLNVLDYSLTINAALILIAYCELTDSSDRRLILLVPRCVLGVQVHRRGDVIQVKVLGIMALIDEGKH